MRFLITCDKKFTKLHMEKSFIESYSSFCGERTQEVFTQCVERSAFFSAILEDDKVIAFNFHRIIELKDGETHLYLEGVPESFLETIRNKHRVLTTEFLTVASSHRGQFTKMQPADLLVGINMHFMKNSICTAIMGYSRQDIKTDRISMKMGTRSMGTVERFGIPCSIVFAEDYSVVNHPLKKMQERIEELWTTRINNAPHLERIPTWTSEEKSKAPDNISTA